MKQLPYTLAFILMMMGFISCQQDEDDTSLTKNRKTVTVAINAPTVEMTALRSTNKSTEPHVLRFVAEIWKNGENKAETFIKRIEHKTDGSQKDAAITFDIEEGDYKLLLWADYIDASANIEGEKYPDKYYNTANKTETDSYLGLKQVSLNETAFSLNNENRDAFYGSVDFVKDKQELQLPKQTLKRSLAKMTVSEKNKNAFDNCKSLSVNYNVPNTFNVATGNTGVSTYTLNITDITPIGGASETAPLPLFFDYILVSKNGSTMNEIKITGKNMAGSDMTPYVIPANVPVKQNTRTNLSGSILEAPAPLPEGEKVDIEVGVEEGWEAPDSDIEDWEGKAFLGEGTVDNPYLIATNKDLVKLSKLINNGDISYKGKYFKQTTNIDLLENETQYKVTIGDSQTNYFEGYYDGAGYTITNLNNSTNLAADCSALFGAIKNSEIKNVRIKKGKNISSATAVGGICGIILKGEKETTISGCEYEVIQITGNDPAIQPEPSALNKGPKSIGGICARIEGNASIIACKLSYSGSTGVKSNTSITEYIGGIVGNIIDGVNVNIIACYNTCKIIAPASLAQDIEYHAAAICGYNKGILSITESYNIGLVQLPNGADVNNFLNATLGMFLGDKNNSGTTVTNCYFTGKVDNTIGTHNGATRFGADKWPTWETGFDKYWSNLGAFNAEASLITYPSLSWE